MRSLRSSLFDDAGHAGDAGGDVLGDIVCSREEYYSAATAMGAMHNYFAAAPANVQAQFKSEVNSLVNTWNAVEEKYQSNWVNTNVGLCQFKDLGVKAQALGKRIAEASGQAPPTEDPNLKPGPFDDLEQFLVGTAKAAVVAVGAYAVYRAIEREK